jgi:hypothetical protein
MAADVAVIPKTLPNAKTGSTGTAAMIKKTNAPQKASSDAALELVHPFLATTETTTGPSMNPTLPPPAINPLATAPALK